MEKPKAKKDWVFREEEEGAFLFDPQSGSIKVLNRVGAFIWPLLDGKKTTEEITQRVIKAFDNSEAKQVEGDVQSFLTELEKLALLE